MDQPILVIGAGPTGLTMACELARHGAAVRIIDRLAAVRPSCRATGIHSRTLEIFHDLGVVDEVLAAGQVLRASNQFVDGERVAHFRLDTVDSPYPFTIALEQCRTEAILEGLLCRLGVRVEREIELVAMRDRLDGIHATLRHPDGREEAVETPWLIACDGAHSTVRHLNHQHFPGDSDPRQFVLADVVVTPAMARDEMYSFVSARGMLLAFPLPAGRTLLIADVPDAHDCETETPPVEEVQDLCARRGPAGMRATAPRWLSYFRIHYRLTPHYRHGRSFLAGDAAHIHSPVGGQGMNTGIQDAYNLAWKLALVWRRRAPRSLLDTYEQERRAVAQDVLASTRAMTEQVEALCDRRDAVHSLAALVPEPDRVRQGRHREELDLDYRRSPICSEHLVTAAGSLTDEAPHAGAQAPDAGPLRLGKGTATLFEILRGPRHSALLFDTPGHPPAREHLLELAGSLARGYADVLNVYWVDGDDRPAPAGVAVLHDRDGALRRRYGGPAAALYLIRPDGYVGYRSNAPDRRHLEHHLEKLFCL